MKPRIMISRCLGFDRCRYDGQSIRFDLLHAMKDVIDFIPICPEADIGLGCPRESLRLVRIEDEIELVQNISKKVLTRDMKLYAEETLNRFSDIDGFILKSRSPSCGMKDVKVYSNMDKAPIIERGAGIFAQEVQRKYPHLPMEEEGRLSNLRIREHFFTYLFAVFHFKNIAKRKSISELNRFHANNKYLYFAYSQVQKNKLGAIIAKYNRINTDEVFNEYFAEMVKLFSQIPTTRNYINAFQHILGYFSNQTGREEKAFILDLMDKYKNGKTEKSSISSILKIYSIKYNTEYLLKQTIFEPFPEKLLLLSNSGNE